MKKPDINDVIEYVRAGETDPAMERALEISPDGQELLKQARFVCAVLRHQSASSGEDGIIAVSDNLMGGARELEDPIPFDFPEVLIGKTPKSGRSEHFRLRDEPKPSILDRIEYFGVDSEELGALEFEAQGEMLFASYQPSKAVIIRYSKQSELSWLSQNNDEDIVIQGRGVTLTIAPRIIVGQPASIRVARGFKRTPARLLGLIFMPDSGPFLRLKTDKAGVAELPALDQPGTVRIETPIPQLLHINYKK